MSESDKAREAGEEFARQFTAAFVEMSTKVRLAMRQQAQSALRASTGMSRGTEAMRWKFFVAAERNKADAFLETEVRRARADLRARGLNIPRR